MKLALDQRPNYAFDRKQDQRDCFDSDHIKFMRFDRWKVIRNAERHMPDRYAHRRQICGAPAAFFRNAGRI